MGAQSRNASREGGKGRRRWFDWHSWTGVVGGLLLFIICWSGSFATLSHELDWLVNPALRVQPSGPPAGLAAIHDAVAREMPDARIRAVAKPLYETFAADVIVSGADDRRRHVYVDPYTLEVTGTASYFTLQRFFRDFHMNFYGLLDVGKYAVTIMALPLLVSLVTSLVFYKRWWRRFLELRMGKGGRAFWSSLHKTAGLWSIWFLLVIGITSVWYLFEASRADFIDGKFSYVDASASAVHPLPPLDLEEGESLPFGVLLDRVHQVRPDLDIRHVSVSRGGYFYAIGQAGEVLVRDRANKIFLDARDGSTVYTQTAADLDPYWRWSDMADPLHFGTFGGLFTKLIWFLFGLILSGLSATGAWLHLKRLSRDADRNYWTGAVTAAGISIAVLLYCAGSAVLYPAGGSGATIFSAGGPPAGILLVAGLWTCFTLAICLLWLWGLRRAAMGGALPVRPVASGQT
jgi:uncharacterized iron-regulated membrane protein